MGRRTVLAFAIALAIVPAVSAQTPPLSPAPSSPTAIEPDRPDVTNGAHIVGTGLVQFELGGTLTAVSADQHNAGTPITVRFGIAKWLEARVAADGLVSLSDGRSRATGFGNVQLAAKVRLLGDENGVALISVLPSVNLPTASAEKGLGSGDADYTALLCTGIDLGSRGHIDFNYGIGAIGTGEGQPHFAQHLGSASASLTIEKWNPFLELYAFSRTEPDGGPNAAVDIGVIYTVRPRLAIDGGLLFGVSRAAPGFTAFGGLSFNVGTVRPSSATSAFRRGEIAVEDLR